MAENIKYAICKRRGGHPLFLLSKGVEFMLLIQTKSEFDELISKIMKLVKEYERNSMYHNEYQIYLASGQNIKFTFGEQNIGHLLDINLDYLRATGLFKNKEGYPLLKEFLENSYTVYRQVQEGHMSFKLIFSDYISDKLEIFEMITNYFSANDIELVCQYNKSRIYQVDEEIDYPCDYFIVKKNLQGDLLVLGLIDKGNICYPMTSMLFKMDETQNNKLRKILQNQVITYVTTINIKNPVNNFQKISRLNLDQCLKKNTKLKICRNLFPGVSVDSISHHEFITNGYIQKLEQLKSYKNLFVQFKNKIDSHELFELDQLSPEIKENLDAEWIDMIQSYNDQLCTQSTSNIVQKTYTNLLTENNQLSDEVVSLQEQLEQVKKEKEQLVSQITQIQAQNEVYASFQNEIFEVVEKQKRK